MPRCTSTTAPGWRSSARSCWASSSRPSTRRSSDRSCRASSASSTAVDYYTWVVTAYLLTSTVTVPIYGKLSDLYGRKPMLMVGIGLFLVGSALSGLSQTMWQIVLFRGIQGLGAGALFPISLAVIGDLFSPAERGKYQGLFGAVFGVSFLIGPWLGGFLTDDVLLALGLLRQPADRRDCALHHLRACSRTSVARVRRPRSTGWASEPSPPPSCRSSSASPRRRAATGATRSCGACS